MGNKLYITCRLCGKGFFSFPSQSRVYCSNTCRYRSLLGSKPANKDAHLDPEYFLSFVTAVADCLEWNGHRNKAGYGHIGVGGKLRLTHRHAWMLKNGSIPDGLFVLHHCDNPACVNVEHLYLGTKADNARDRSERKRYRDDRGERHPSAKLSDADVLRIRERCQQGERRVEIARDVHVTSQMIYRIETRQAWRHI